MPKSKNTLGSFEEWSKVIGGIMEHAGFTEFLGNMLEFYEEADAGAMAWRGLCSDWWERFQGEPVKASDLWDIAKDIDGLPVISKTEDGRRTQFGLILAKQKDRVFDTFQIKSAGRHRNKPLWKLLKAGTRDKHEELFQ